MAAAGTITKSAEMAKIETGTIALAPSKFVFTVEGKRFEFTSYEQAWTAQCQARTFEFEASEITAVHKVEFAGEGS